MPNRFKAIIFLFGVLNFDAFVKSPKTLFSVIPAKAGIQCFHAIAKPLDPVFSTLRSNATAEDGQRGDGFLRSRQFWL